MGKELQRSTETDKRNIQSKHGNNPQPYSGTSGRRRKKREPEEAPVDVLLKTVNHFFPDMNDWFNEVKEFRNVIMCRYTRSHLIWSGVLMYLLHCGSRMQYNCETDTREFTINMKKLCGQKDVDTMAHGDTVAWFLSNVSDDCFKVILSKLIKRLIRMKALDAFRFNGYFTIAIDGTGVHSFDKEPWPDCPYKTINGKKIYQLYVVDAKLVTPSGLSLTIATVCLENEKDFKKQDCEKKAFYRLHEEIKHFYPRTKFCFLLDSLFADRSVISSIEKSNNKYMIMFKPGSMPERYKETLSLAKMQSENKKTEKDTNEHHTVQWVEQLPLGDFKSNVLFCKTKDKEKTTRFVWLTNFNINKYNACQLAKGGRLRWKIENEGFKVQKKNGYEMEHMYSRHLNGFKNLYIILQIAHIINQLIQHGSLIKNFKATYQTMKNFVRRMAESLRNNTAVYIGNTPGQIRLKAPT